MFFLGLLLVFIYGGGTTLSGAIQLQKKKIPYLAAISLCLLGLLLILSACLSSTFPFALFILVFVLLLMHSVALFNGFHMYGKINPLHHIIRFCLSCIIIFIFAVKHLY